MPTFTYKGTTADGRAVERTIEAADRYLVYDRAREAGHAVGSIEEQKNAPAKTPRVFAGAFPLLNIVRLDDLVMLARSLSAMLRAGLALARALSVAERQSGSAGLRRVLAEVRADVEKGKPFHDALALRPRVFSRLFIAMAHTGEEGGTLTDALAAIAAHLEQSSNLRKKIRGAMVYPAIVLGALTAIGVLMLVFVVPTLSETLRALNVDLPLSTRVVLALSGFLTAHTLSAGGLLLALAVGAFFLSRIRVVRRATHFALIRLPLTGVLVRETNAAHTARSLSSLLSAGVPVVQALSITSEVVQNVFYQAALARAASAVEKGRPLAEEFARAERLYPPLFGEMLAVGEETGDVSGMLTEVARFYESEVERKTKNLSVTVEPLLMLVVGAAVGLFALAMIAPIYSISDSIS